jgi:transcriptional/translational regulatory protein YebC/TACO1
MELALEAGAEDFKADEHGYEVLTDPGHFETVAKAIEAKGIKPAGAEVTWLPTLTVPLSDAKFVEETTRLIDLLEEHDDVKDVYSNAEFPA